MEKRSTGGKVLAAAVLCSLSVSLVAPAHAAQMVSSEMRVGGAVSAPRTVVDPTDVPTTEPTTEPTVAPTEEPTTEPTETPTEPTEPTEEPSPEPEPEPVYAAPEFKDVSVLGAESFEVDGKTWHKGDVEWKLQVTDGSGETKNYSAKRDDNLLNVTTTEVTPVDPADPRKVDATVEVPAGATPADGKVALEFTATDEDGIEVKHDTEFLYDDEAPKLENGVADGTVETVKGVTYSGKAFNVNFDASDLGSGIEKIELRKKAEDDSMVVEKVVTGNKLVIAASGYYDVRVTDKVGNERILTLAQLGSGLASEVVISTSTPTAVVQVNGADRLESWYKDAANVNIEVNDGRFLRSVIAEVNGVEVHNYYGSQGTVSIAKNLKDLPRAADGLYKFTITSKNIFGNKIVTEFTVKADFDNPVLSGGVLEGFSEETEGTTYIKNSAVAKFKASDIGAGVESVEILKDGEVVKTFTAGGDLSYTISSSGTYSFNAVDKVGHAKAYTFAEVFGTSGKIVSDNGAPKITGGLQGTGVDIDGKNWFAAKPKYIYTVTDDNLGRVTYEVNGTRVYRGSQTEPYMLDLATAGVAANADGSYLVSVSARDRSGNTTEVESLVYVDEKAPVLDSGSLDGYFSEKAGTTYIKDKLGIRFNSSDLGSGLSKVEIVKDGAVAKTFNAEGTHEFSIDASGSYSLRVEDKVGHVTNYSFKDLFGTEGKIISDTAVPVLKSTVEAGGVDLNGKLWFSKKPVVTYSATDNNMHEVIYTVNGQVIHSSAVAGDYAIDLSKVNVEPNPDGSYTVGVRAADKSGNETSSSFKVFVDESAPVLQDGSLSGFNSEKDGVTYIRDGVTVTFNGSDTGSGVAQIEVLQNGKPFKAFSSEGKHSFEIVDSGTYTLRITDKVGLTKNYTFKDLFGTNGVVVADTLSPVLRSSVEDGGVMLGGEQWFSKKPVVSYSATDTNLHEVVYAVNGQEVFRGIPDGSHKIDLSGVATEPNKDGSYVVTATAVDKSDNRTNSSVKLFVDEAKPNLGDGSLEGYNSEKGGTTYIRESINLTVKASDVGSGVKKVELLKDGIVVKTSTSDGDINFRIAESGQYTLSITDKVNNKVDYSFKSLFGTSGTVVSDTVAPGITGGVQDGGKEIGGNVWFSEKPNFTYDVNDANLHEVVYLINGKEVHKGADTKYTVNVAKSGVEANEDGSYIVTVNAVDKSGNTSSKESRVYVDSVAPVVEEFVFDGGGYKEGQVIGGSDNYGFFFQNSTGVEVRVTDSGPSSGLKEIQFELINHAGGTSSGTAAIVGGKAQITVPGDFKGTVRAKAVDRVDNVSAKWAQPDAVITESKNWRVNTAKLNLSLPETQYSDSKGNPLYSSNQAANLVLKETVAGVRSASWGVGEATLGSIEVGQNGNISGGGFSISGRDKNLVVDLSTVLPIDGNTNAMNIWIKVTDRAGYSSSTDKTISIDKDAPTYTVNYNQTNENGYYNALRTATITVTERNFDQSLVKIDGTPGTLSGWSNTGGDTWVASMTFNEEKEYKWSMSMADRAGNQGAAYSSETFTYDSTAPDMNVVFNNNDSANEKYFNKGRTATATVIDKNFDPSGVTYTGDGKIVGWSTSGDSHTATVAFNEDGEFKFAMSVKDKANNISKDYDSGDFIVDQTIPKVDVTGVSAGVAYSKDVSFGVALSDKYLDAKKTTVTLKGRTVGEVPLSGGVKGTDGAFSLGSIPKKKEFDDSYTLSVTAIDMAGNEFKEDVEFIVNRFGSQFNFLDDSYLGKYMQSMDSDVVLTESSVERLNMDSIRIVVLRDGQEIEVPKNLVSITESGGKDSPWVYTYRVKKSAFTEDGTYQVQVYSASKSGVENSSLSQEYVFVIDGTKPEIVVSGIEAGGEYREVSRTVTVEARDKGGMDNIEIRLNGQAVQGKQEGETHVFSIPEGGGLNTVEVVAKDKAGNIEELSVDRVLVTTSVVEAFWQKAIGKWIAWLLGGIAALFLVMIGWRSKKRKDADNARRELNEQSSLASQENSAGSDGFEEPLDPATEGTVEGLDGAEGR